MEGKQKLLTISDRRWDGYHWHKQTQASIYSQKNFIFQAAIFLGIKHCHPNQTSRGDGVRDEGHQGQRGVPQLVGSCACSPVSPEVEKRKGWGEDRSVDSPTISTTLQALLANAVRSQTILRSYSGDLSLYQFLWITTNCGKFLRDGNTRPPDLPPEKPVCRSGSNSQNWTWNNGLVPNWEWEGCMLLPCLFNFYVGYIMRKARLDESQAGIKTARRIINNLKYADDTTLMAENKEELNRLFIRREWKSWPETQHSRN